MLLPLPPLIDTARRAHCQPAHSACSVHLLPHTHREGLGVCDLTCPAPLAPLCLHSRDTLSSSVASLYSACCSLSAVGSFSWSCAQARERALQAPVMQRPAVHRYVHTMHFMHSSMHPAQDHAEGGGGGCMHAHRLMQQGSLPGLCFGAHTHRCCDCAAAAGARAGHLCLLPLKRHCTAERARTHAVIQGWCVP